MAFLNSRSFEAKTALTSALSDTDIPSIDLLEGIGLRREAGE